jgi:16S rRNA (guanine527-N7)-methyltransferase
MSEPSPEAAAVFGANLPRAERYAELLCAEGVAWGLIGPREAPRIWSRHLLNSAALAQWLPSTPAASADPTAHRVSVVDVGSGAGLPGIPLALARPDLQMTLLEPLLRRTRFLELVRDELELDVEVCRARAEAIAPRHFDVVTARAVAPLERLVDLCLPLLAPGGTILALKGQSAAEELAVARPALRRAGVDGSVLRAEIADEPAVAVRLARKSGAPR